MKAPKGHTFICTVCRKEAIDSDAYEEGCEPFLVQVADIKRDAKGRIEEVRAPEYGVTRVERRRA